MINEGSANSLQMNGMSPVACRALVSRYQPHSSPISRALNGATIYIIFEGRRIPDELDLLLYVIDGSYMICPHNFLKHIHLVVI